MNQKMYEEFVFSFCWILLGFFHLIFFFFLFSSIKETLKNVCCKGAFFIVGYILKCSLN